MPQPAEFWSLFGDAPSCAWCSRRVLMETGISVALPGDPYWMGGLYPFHPECLSQLAEEAQTDIAFARAFARVTGKSSGCCNGR